MSEPVARLADLQHWMQSIIVHPGCVHDALGSGPLDVERLVKPSATLTPAERVGVYHGMYLLRMAEALEIDYPTLAAYLGTEGFGALVRDYVQAHPSTSYTLNRLGDSLPEFVRTWGVPEDAGFLHDLARLERAVSECFDAEDSGALSAEDVQAIPPDDWPGLRLVASPALRVLAFAHPVTESLASAKRGDKLHRLRRRTSWAVLYRSQLTVMRMDLSRAEHDLLSALASGVPLGEAIESATSELKASERRDRVFTWFRTWIARGMFRGVERG